MSAVSVEAVGRTVEALLSREGRDILYRDPATGTNLTITPAIAASPDGLLPAFVVAGEAVWREATGRGFELDIVRDREALLGYRLRGIGAGTFTTVMLATMEATAQVAGPTAIVVNDLHLLWSAATDRFRHDPAPDPHIQSRAHGVAP